jgi:hypothetical protein
MSVSALRARLSALRKDIPAHPNESMVKDYNSIVAGFEAELHDPEFGHFKIAEVDVKPRVVNLSPTQGITYSKGNYCERGLFKRTVEGLWSYLQHQRIVEEPGRRKPHKKPKSQVINFNGPVTGSTIQQGDHNTVVNYQNDLRAVLDEIRSVLNAARLSADAKQELTSDVETVEAQMKSPKPKFSIIRESLVSARHILEHAVGAGMAHAYFPLLVAFLERHH